LPSEKRTTLRSVFVVTGGLRPSAIIRRKHPAIRRSLAPASRRASATEALHGIRLALGVLPLSSPSTSTI
jgi:hypothetical protein